MRRPVLLRTLAALSALVGPAIALANIIEGPAEVIDGDSLKVGGTEVRLFGVDAPEYAQTCFSNGTPVPCGKMAKEALEGLIDGARLVCLPQDTDVHGRTVARCQTAGVDIGAALVTSGWATAFTRYSADYVAAEARARAARAGIWQWDFQSPADFRAARQMAPAQQRAARNPSRAGTVPAQRIAQGGQCLIKGNHSRKGEYIYHLPGMPYYAQTRAEEYFCTEAQAQAAGYRRSRAR
ncbi:MAG: thermonuclease family protein [Porphyrobacter sp.]|nr:thermonuclease family protein [Porphyrobacter sp.]